MAVSTHTEGLALFEQGGGAVPGPIVFLTNRFNLLEVLSSGLVTPRAGFRKYYADFLELAQGRIPLFQAPLSRDLCARASSGDDACFPVAIEIDAAKLAPTPVAALGNDGIPSTALVERGRARMWAPGGLIPSVALRCVHFRSQSELEEHALREYENIFPNQLALIANPELFEKGVWMSAEVDKWLTALAPVTAPTDEDFALYDRLAGARCLALHEAPAEWLGGMVAFLGAGEPSGSLRSGLPSWLSAENTIRPREKGWRGKSTEERLYCSAVRVLRYVNSAEAWRPLEVLAEVESAVAGTQPPKKDEAQLSKQFEACRAILRNEREFKPFRSGVGSPVIKGLLMVLMRPEPARLLRWPRVESGADDEVQLTAAILAGVLHGHKRLSTDYRRPELDAVIALMSAEQISAGLAEALRPAPRQAEMTAVTRPTSGDVEDVSLIWNGAPIVTRQTRPRGLADLLGALDPGDPRVSRALAEICIELGWDECVRSVVTTTDRNWTTSPQPSGPGIDILVRGPVTVRVEVQKEALRERFAQAHLGAADEDRLAQRLRALGAAGGAAPGAVQRAGSPTEERKSQTGKKAALNRTARRRTNG